MSVLDTIPLKKDKKKNMVLAIFRPGLLEYTGCKVGGTEGMGVSFKVQ